MQTPVQADWIEKPLFILRYRCAFSCVMKINGEGTNLYNVPSDFLSCPMPRREALPDDLKELCSLCRAGKLFAVQEWIEAGKRYRLPEGNFTTSPLRLAIKCGFHSLVEVFLRAGISDEEKNDALLKAVRERNLDLVQLLTQYGADVKAIHQDEIFWSRHPGIMRWFIDNGMDLEEGEPIAKAFRDKHREFLGIYMGLRDQVPSARMQATMALRHHAEEGNLKWVSLLLWAGADPRLRVPRIGRLDGDEEDNDTALNEAIRYGHVEIVKKMRVDASCDDVTQLLNQYFIRPNPDVIELLISKGADVHSLGSDVIESVFSEFEWSLDPLMGRDWSRTEAALRCMEILAANGARWAPQDPYRVRCLRRSLGKTAPYDAIRHLGRIVKSGVIEQSMFKDLMRTPKMKEILKQPYSGVTELRRFAN